MGDEHLSTPAKKKRIIELLTAGWSPGKVALAVQMSRSQMYVWKDKDPKFAAKWEDAVATCLDILESSIYDRALAGSDPMATLIMKGRRSEVYNPHAAAAAAVVGAAPTSVSNTYNLLTVPEALEQVKRLGLPMPMLVRDYVEEEKTDAGPAHRSNDTVRR